MHGGNDFKPLLRTLAGDDIHVFLCNWFQICLLYTSDAADE